jgi:hypothetical protein
MKDLINEERTTVNRLENTQPSPQPSLSEHLAAADVKVLLAIAQLLDEPLPRRTVGPFKR